MEAPDRESLFDMVKWSLFSTCVRGGVEIRQTYLLMYIRFSPPFSLDGRIITQSREKRRLLFRMFAQFISNFILLHLPPVDLFRLHFIERVL